MKLNTILLFILIIFLELGCRDTTSQIKRLKLINTRDTLNLESYCDIYKGHNKLFIFSNKRDRKNDSVVYTSYKNYKLINNSYYELKLIFSLDSIVSYKYILSFSTLSDTSFVIKYNDIYFSNNSKNIPAPNGSEDYFYRIVKINNQDFMLHKSNLYDSTIFEEYYYDAGYNINMVIENYKNTKHIYR